MEQMDFRKVRVETATGVAKLKMPKTMAVESMVPQTAVIKVVFMQVASLMLCQLGSKQASVTRFDLTFRIKTGLLSASEVSRRVLCRLP